MAGIRRLSQLLSVRRSSERRRSMGRLLLRSPKGLSSTLAVNVTNMLLGVVTGVATARGLQPDERGVLLALILWSSTASTFSLLGLDESVVYHSAGSRTQALALRRQLTRYIWPQVAVGLALLITINVVIVRDGSDSLLLTALGISLIVPLNAYTQMCMAPLRVAEEFGVWNALRLVPASIYASSVLCLAALDKLSIPNGVGGLLIGSIITALASWLVTRKRSAFVAVSPSAATTSQVRRYGRRVFVASVPYVANQRLDQLLLGVLVAPRNLGIYAVAVSITAVVQMIGTTLEQVIFPRMMAGTLNSKKIPRILVASCGGTALLGFGLSIMAESLIRFVYGSSYVEAALPLQILAVGVLFVVASAILTAEAKAQNRLHDLIFGQVIGTVITVLLLPLLVIRYDLIGAASTSTVAYAVTFFILIFRRNRHKRGHL